MRGAPEGALPMGERIVVVFDSDCGFCQACVDWLASRARREGVEIDCVAYEDLSARDRYPEIDWGHGDSGMQIRLADLRVRKDIRAVAASLALLRNWRWLGRLLDFWMFRSINQLGYRVVAMNRRRISGWMGLRQCNMRPRG